MNRRGGSLLKVMCNIFKFLTVSNQERSLFIPTAAVRKEHAESEAEKHDLNPFPLMAIHIVYSFHILLDVRKIPLSLLKADLHLNCLSPAVFLFIVLKNCL